ncbi:hypothetical protein JQ633_00085 [Bradyrhizobium tropiciagri]|uniref:hypothetical protein n=1 Tax=Bradyrhizobium tropiciagri TaxID=312253 RepID=UPI001BA85BCA|nr:hypothetical protein [Bradyrhizobium tropiciagri]MBR0868736.1 hypothetical protein [Bradyrhizobium tropiciagri]
MYFQFTADRFGFATTRDAEDEIGYARAALDALDSWSDTIKNLLGDSDRGQLAVGNARLLPLNPTWNSTSDARQRVRDNLGGRIETLPKSGELIDQGTRDAVEELRNYLRMLWTWHRTIEAGLWVATIAAQGSTSDDPRQALLRGVAAIEEVGEFDNVDTPKRILEALREVVTQADSVVANTTGTSALTDRIVAVVRDAAAALRRDADADELTDPKLLGGWAADLRKKLSRHQHEKRLPVGEWTAVEGIYWRQWQWPMEGAVRRKEPFDKIDRMSVFDLMMAARYANDIFLHWRGGLLSIAQWSRILSVTSPARLETIREPAQAAISQLGFPELVALLARTETPTKLTIRSGNAPPLVALSLQEESALQSWRPDSAVRAFALRPRPQEENDVQIAHDGTGKDMRDSTLAHLIDSYFTERGIAKLHLVEVPPRGTIKEMARKMGWLAGEIGWSRVYCCETVLTGSDRSLLLSARDVRELVEDVRRKFPELLARESISILGRLYADIYRSFRRIVVATGSQDWRIVRLLQRIFGPTDSSAS